MEAAAEEMEEEEMEEEGAVAEEARDETKAAAIGGGAAIGAAVSAVVPAAATAALVQNPYGPEALGYTQPVDSAVPVATARCPGLLGRTRVLLVQPAITAHSRRA